MSVLFRSAVLSAIACVAASAASVDTGLLGLVPPDATVISSISVAQAKNSTFGQYLLSQMEVGPGFQQFITETGFDPRHDLTLVMSVTTPASTTDTSADAVLIHNTLILGRGNFNISKIEAAAKGQGATIQTYKGVDLILTTDTGRQGAAAFPDATTVVMGEVQAVQAALDRRGQSTKLAAAVLTQVNALAAANDAWFLSTVSPSVFFSGKIGNPQVGSTLDAGLAQSVLSGSGGFKFTGSGALLTGQAVARSPQDASALSDVFRFLTNIAQSSRGTSAQAGMFASMLDTLQITTQGSNMNLSLQIPETTLEQLFMNGPKAGQSQRASRHRQELH